MKDKEIISEILEQKLNSGKNWTVEELMLEAMKRKEESLKIKYKELSSPKDWKKYPTIDDKGRQPKRIEKEMKK